MEIRANERDAKNKSPIQTRECAHRYLFRSKFVLAKRREREKKTYLFSTRCYCFPVPRRSDDDDGANFCSRKKPERSQSSTPKTIANARCIKRG